MLSKKFKRILFSKNILLVSLLFVCLILVLISWLPRLLTSVKSVDIDVIESVPKVTLQFKQITPNPIVPGQVVRYSVVANTLSDTPILGLAFSLKNECKLSSEALETDVALSQVDSISKWFKTAESDLNFVFVTKQTTPLILKNNGVVASFNLTAPSTNSGCNYSISAIKNSKNPSIIHQNKEEVLDLDNSFKLLPLNIQFPK